MSLFLSVWHIRVENVNSSQGSVEIGRHEHQVLQRQEVVSMVTALVLTSKSHLLLTYTPSQF